MSACATLPQPVEAATSPSTGGGGYIPGNAINRLVTIIALTTMRRTTGGGRQVPVSKKGLPARIALTMLSKHL